MKTLLKMLVYAMVACTFLMVYLISPRMYVVMAIGFAVYALSVLISHVYGCYVRLLSMRIKSSLKKFRAGRLIPELPSPMSV